LPIRRSGGFIELDDDAMKLTRQDWEAFLGRMAEIKLDALIIQRLEYVSPKGEFKSYHRQDRTDPTEEILRYADGHRMRVFVGLRQDEASVRRPSSRRTSPLRSSPSIGR
jgi:hypothetical protein